MFIVHVKVMPMTGKMNIFKMHTFTKCTTNIQKAWEPEQALGDNRIRRRGQLQHEDWEFGHHQHYQVSLCANDHQNDILFQFQVGRIFWGDHRWRQKGEYKKRLFSFLDISSSLLLTRCWARWAWWSRTRWCTRCWAPMGARTACARGSFSGRRWSMFARFDNAADLVHVMSCCVP